MTHIKTIGIVGAGTMGAGIAQTAATSGFVVQLIDAKPEFVERGLGRIESDLEAGVARGKITGEDEQQTIANITGGVDYGALAQCELVIEAVPETLAIKEPVLRAISAAVTPETIIASNTSSLSIATLAGFVDHPERLAGMHFFNPVPRMALVEVVTGDATSAATVETILSVAAAMGKTPVRSADKPGFIVNRVLIPMINEAARALEDGVASAEDIDTAMKLGAGHPMGPLALADLIGLDVVLDIMRVLHSELGSAYAPAASLESMVRDGTLGRKSGSGFFSYAKDR